MLHPKRGRSISPSFQKKLLTAASLLSQMPVEKIMIGGGRKSHTIEYRAATMIACRRLGFSTPAIAKLLGGCDHTTVLHHLQKRNAELDEIADELIKMIKVKVPANQFIGPIAPTQNQLALKALRDRALRAAALRSTIRGV